MMKKISFVLAMIIVVCSFCSCGKKDVQKETETDKFKVFETDEYSIKYESSIFEYKKDSKGDLFYLKNGEKETNLTVTKYEDKTIKQLCDLTEVDFKKKGYEDVTTDASPIIGVKEGTMSVTGFSGDYERIYETHIYECDSGVYTVSFNYSTSLDDVNIQNTLYESIASFKIKEKK